MTARVHRASSPILLVTEVLPPAVGGSGVLLEGVYSRLGVPVTVLTDRTTCPGPPLETRGRMAIERTGIRGDAWGVLDPSALVQHGRLAGLIRARSRGAVVHCGRAQPEGIAALLASRLPGGAPYVLWAHGEEISTAQTSRELRWVMHRVHAGARAFLANSHNTAAMLRQAGVRADKITVIHPGVDVERFHPSLDATALRQRLMPEDGLLLLSAGRLERRKGHDLVLAALGRVRHRLGTIRYVIVGGGGERTRLEGLAREHGVADLVHFAGEVTAADLPLYYAACDLFLHPNRVVDGFDLEGFGIVFLEAAACGKPVIGGNSGGVPEAVAAGITGLLVSGTDADELAHAIERLAVDPALRRAMGDAGRARVCAEFTWGASARRLEAFHEQFGRR